MVEYQPLAGIVSDNHDPDGLNRIRVHFPYLEGAQVSGWIPYQALMVGEETGIAALPEIGTVVTVNALDKYRTKMIATSVVYTEKHKPPKTEENGEADLNQDGNNSLRFIKSRSGYQIIFDDSDGKDKLQLVSPDQKTRIEIDTEGALVNVETDKDYGVEAKGEISLAAEKITVTAEKEFNVSGEAIQVKSTESLEITGDKEITVKGSSVSLN